MFRTDPAGVAYSVAGVVFVLVAAVTWRRRTLNPPVARALVAVMLGACWWSVADAVAVAAVEPRVAGVASLAIFPGLGVTVATFVWLAATLARTHGSPRRRLLAGLLVEPVLITAAAATNPWHALVYTGAGTPDLTGSALWGFGPLFWVHSLYCYAVLAVGIAMVGHAWWTAPAAFRAQRLGLLVAVLVPAVGNALNLLGALPVDLDPTPLGLAGTGVVMAYALFREHLFTFTPVARALIIEGISDAIVAVSPMGRVIDVNAAAVDLVHRIDPGATQIIGARAADLLPASMAGTDEATEVHVDLDGRPAELHVRSSRLVGRRGRSLGSVLVARDVTEVAAQRRHLAEANARLTEQVATIERLRSDLAELAGRDALTGLHNRRHLVTEFAALLAAAGSSGEPLSVVLLDVDRFKSINDRHGHLTGDAVLVAVAHLLAGAAPDGALVARWGGEEFFVALPRTSGPEAASFADGVRARLERDGVAVAGRTIPCTVSGGVATSTADGATTDALFHAADVRLHAAKRSGRNRVLACGPGVPPPAGHAPAALVTPEPVAAGGGDGPRPRRERGSALG
ncbi:histidine kinase N-terminal 7TM domain-containing diguanylate cyclase [Cellulomonas aerilata]|uniref:histidine kinase N-terminal 7TM domain-containing diguanylate cyclase n=1 Tax=Cellulomonas aerilata TaxID=515326 RepID=UPI001649E962|nr:histidine kinase N-terminal 7TM domain-containing protein [Cellulomonas aerilata]